MALIKFNVILSIFMYAWAKSVIIGIKQTKIFPPILIKLLEHNNQATQ